MTSGLPQVCKLLLGVSKGMLPVKHVAQKILKVMAVNHSGHQLARRLGWVAPAYHEQDGIREHASLAFSMTGGVMSALGCRLECGIKVV